MSQATETGHAAGTTTDSTWKGGVLGGIAGAAVMAVLISLMRPPTLEVAIPSLYALAPPPNGVAGWVVHLSHGAVLGLAFAGIAEATGVRESLGRSVGLGVLWGVVTWAVLAALVIPVWLDAVGSPANPPFPNFATPSLLWHLAYGVVLGALYPSLERL
jgi:hypothetical protein